MARQQVARIVVDSIARVVYTSKLSQPLHALDPAFDSRALINHANKLKEAALHMACMMERSKVTGDFVALDAFIACSHRVVTGVHRQL